MDYFRGADYYNTEPIWRLQIAQMVSDWRGSICPREACRRLVAIVTRYTVTSLWLRSCNCSISCVSRSSPLFQSRHASTASFVLVALKEIGVIEISSLLQSRVHRGHSGGVEGVGRKKVNGADVSRSEEHTYILMCKGILPWNCESLW